MSTNKDDCLPPTEQQEAIPMPSENPKGFHQRYKVAKTSGEKIDDNAQYIVLRLDWGGSDKEHVKAGRMAARTYANAIAHHLPKVAEDILRMYPDEDNQQPEPIPQEIMDWITKTSVEIWNREGAIMEPGELADKVAMAMYQKMREDRDKQLAGMRKDADGMCAEIKALQAEISTQGETIAQLLERLKESDTQIDDLLEKNQTMAQHFSLELLIAEGKNAKLLASNKEWGEKYADACREREAALALINTPQSADFIEAVKCEMAHQQERWGDEAAKYPHDFALVLSYLHGKLIKAIFDKTPDKFTHHVITTAAVAGVIHKYFNEDSNTKWHFYPPEPSKPTQQ